MVMNPRTHPKGAAPDFALPKPNPSKYQTDALWWLVCMRLALVPGTLNAGTYANKPGSHNIGKNLPASDHSLHPNSVNKTGPWWQNYCAAHDWTFSDAQKGDFKTISLYTDRLMKAMENKNDPRPGMIYHYTIGQRDKDRVVEAYHELDERAFTSDDLTHLWHRHDSFQRSKVGDFWAMWAALTIDMGWSVDDWRKSLPSNAPKPPAPKPPATPKLPVFVNGTRVLMYTGADQAPMKGTDVLFIQKFCGGEKHFGKLDGVAGPKFVDGVKRYQGIRKIKQDGIVGPKTWQQTGTSWTG